MIAILVMLHKNGGKFNMYDALCEWQIRGSTKQENKLHRWYDNLEMPLMRYGVLWLVMMSM